jgi:hypothetical protein
MLPIILTGLVFVIGQKIGQEIERASCYDMFDMQTVFGEGHTPSSGIWLSLY